MPTRVSTAPNHTHNAIRPTFRLPASSWAEPGTRSVITISETARRNRTRVARSLTLLGCARTSPSYIFGVAPICSGKWLARPVSPVTPVTTAYDAPDGTIWVRPVASVRMKNRPRGSGVPEEGTPEYEWLYGKAGTAGSRGSAAGDETQVIPKAGSPRPDQTRVMPTLPGEHPAPTQPPTRPPTRRGDGPTSPPPGPPPPRIRRWRPRFRVGMVKWVLLLWLVFLVTVPLWAWTKVEKVDAAPNGNRPAEQPGHDVPPGRQRLARRTVRGGPPGQQPGRRRRPAHRHDHAAAHRVRARPADVDPARLDRADPWARGPRRSTRRTPSGGPSSWSAPSRTPPASASTTTSRSASAAS